MVSAVQMKEPWLATRRRDMVICGVNPGDAPTREVAVDGRGPAGLRGIIQDSGLGGEHEREPANARRSGTRGVVTRRARGGVECRMRLPGRLMLIGLSVGCSGAR